MDAVTLAAANASAKKIASAAAIASLDVRPPGRPAVVGSYLNANSTAQTAIGTSRVPYVVGVTGTNLRLIFANWYANTSTFADTDNAAAISVKASVEIGGVLYPVTFGGKLTASIDGGGMVVSEPLAVEVTAGQVLYVRTFITPTTNWYYNHFSYAAAGTGGWTVTTDLTAPGSAAVADTSNKALYGPAQITVEPTGSSRVAVQVFGDSLAHGVGDGVGNSWAGVNVANNRLGGGGFLMRALTGVAGMNQSSLASDTVQSFLTAVGHFRRAALGSLAPVWICQYGRNDISASRTLAQIQADLISLWKLGRGARVWQTTITPKSNSTNGYVDLAGQSVTSTFDPVRVSLNNWLRAGAPLASASNLTAVAVGTAGALLAGQVGHPLRGYLEVADAVESARDSGLWKPMVNQRTVTDLVATAAGFTITSATAAFTTADLGRTIVIQGAGTSGALYTGVIQNYFNATSVGLNVGTPTAVNPATATLGDGYTRDGTHPDTYGAAAMAATINPATL